MLYLLMRWDRTQVIKVRGELHIKHCPPQIQKFRMFTNQSAAQLENILKSQCPSRRRLILSTIPCEKDQFLR